jgi:hypothetical protein
VGVLNWLLPRVIVFVLITLFLSVCLYVEKSGIGHGQEVKEAPELIANFDGLLVYADKMGGYYCKEYNYGVD